MKENYADKVVDRLHERFGRVRERLEERFKGTNPFRQESISEDEMYLYYRQLTPEDMNTLIQQKGPEVVNNFIGRMKQYEQRKKL